MSIRPPTLAARMIPSCSPWRLLTSSTTARSCNWIASGGDIDNTSRIPPITSRSGTTRNAADTTTTMAGSTYAARSGRPLDVNSRAKRNPTSTPADSRASPNHSAASERTRSLPGPADESDLVPRLSTRPTARLAAVAMTAYTIAQPTSTSRPPSKRSMTPPTPAYTQSAPSVAAFRMTTSGSAASLPHGNRSSGPRRTNRRASTARPESPMLTKEYRPSKTIMLDPLTIPQRLENMANPAEAHTDNSSSRRPLAAWPEDTEQDIAISDWDGTECRARRHATAAGGSYS